MYVRVPRPFNQESTVLSTNGAVKNGYSQAKSWTLNLTPFANINSKWTKDLET